MPRAIGTAAGGAPDEYAQRLYKLIPAELTAAHLAISTIVDSNGSNALLYMTIAFLVLLVLLPVYMIRLQGVTNPTQIIISTLSFPVWAVNVSSALIVEYLHFHFHVNVETYVFGVILILWTTITPVFVK